MDILLGSNNRHKQKEFQNLLEVGFGGKFRLFIPNEILKKDVDIDETGSTLQENARLKAMEFNKLTKIPCFADDTGLEIDSLGGLPGVHSARFSGIYGNDSENRKKVLQMMHGVPLEKRTAAFRTVICYFDGTHTHFVEGFCNGKIIYGEKGSNGFGYDSIFLPDGNNLTFAEMTAEEKNKISHRSIAARKFVELLRVLIDG